MTTPAPPIDFATGGNCRTKVSLSVGALGTGDIRFDLYGLPGAPCANITVDQATQIRDALTEAIENVPHPDAELRDTVARKLYCEAYDKLFGSVARQVVDDVIAAVRFAS